MIENNYICVRISYKEGDTYVLKLNISLEVCVECTKKLFGLFDFVSNNEYDPTFIDYVFSKGFVG